MRINVVPLLLLLNLEQFQISNTFVDLYNTYEFQLLFSFNEI